MSAAADALMGIFGFKRVEGEDMKTDRELLELAARAAGIRHIEYANDYDGARGLMLCDEHGRHTDTWSPLTDDGDALRLAVKCSISVNTMLVDGMNRPRHETAACSSYGLPIVHHKHDGDPYAATRRAIVRAAAAIGESK